MDLYIQYVVLSSTEWSDEARRPSYLKSGRMLLWESREEMRVIKQAYRDGASKKSWGLTFPFHPTGRQQNCTCWMPLAAACLLKEWEVVAHSATVLIRTSTIDVPLHFLAQQRYATFGSTLCFLALWNMYAFQAVNSRSLLVRRRN